MTGIVVFVVTLALGYGAYRVIRGGFGRRNRKN
jgi:hypothetical protein